MLTPAGRARPFKHLRDVRHVVVVSDGEVHDHRVTIAVVLRHKWCPCSEDDYCWFVVEFEKHAKELVEELLVSLFTANDAVSRVASDIVSTATPDSRLIVHVKVENDEVRVVRYVVCLRVRVSLERCRGSPPRTPQNE